MISVEQQTGAVWLRPEGFIDEAVARELASHIREHAAPTDVVIDLSAVSGLSSRAHRFWRLWLRQCSCAGATWRLRAGGNATVRMATYFLCYSAGCQVILEE